MDAITDVPAAGQRAGARIRARISRARPAHRGPRRRWPPIRSTCRTSSAAPTAWAAGTRIDVVQPHRHSARLGTLTNAEHADATAAIDAAIAAKAGWAATPFDERAAVFLRAADLLAGPWREKLAAATMLGQSKTAYQAEIDAACELIDFWRFNVGFARQIMAAAADQCARRVEPHRLPSARGLRLRHHAVQLHRHRGQPADRARADGQHRGVEAVATQTFSAYLTMQLLEAAGLPPGVINLVTGDGDRGFRCGTGRSAAGRHPLHRIDGDVPAPVARGRHQHRPLPHLSAAGRRDRRQGLRASPTLRRARMCCAPR